MGNTESNNSHTQNFTEVQKIKDVLNMDTETFVSQKGNGFRKGDRIIHIHNNKKGTIEWLRDDEDERRRRRANPSWIHYAVKYDDGSFESYEDGNNLKLESGEMRSPTIVDGIAEFHIGQRVAVTGKIGFLVPMGDYKQVYGKMGAITKIDTTAPIGKVLYNVLFDDGTAGGEVWEEYITDATTALSESPYAVSSAVASATASPVAPRASPVAPRASPAAPRASTAASHKLRISPAAPAAFDAFGYCNALMSAPDMPDMSGDDITKGLCAALMKK